jgi:hypothetical protein
MGNNNPSMQDMLEKKITFLVYENPHCNRPKPIISKQKNKEKEKEEEEDKDPHFNVNL